MDDMSAKYPDVAAAVQRSAGSGRPFIVDAEIVPIVPSSQPEPAVSAAAAKAGAGVGTASSTVLGTFQTLSTRKRKYVTSENAAIGSTAVTLCAYRHDAVWVQPGFQPRSLLHVGVTCWQVPL